MASFKRLSTSRWRAKWALSPGLSARRPENGRREIFARQAANKTPRLRGFLKRTTGLEPATPSLGS
jgi:hypothetical protein